MHLQVGEFIDTRRKTAVTGDEEPVEMVSIRIGELNKQCRKRGIQGVPEAELRDVISTFDMGRCN